MSRPKTIFLDIDGCILPHPGHPNNHIYDNLTPLEGVKTTLDKWIMKDYKIILVTGRKECVREETIKQLKQHGITWDQLIMGVGGGTRILINDTKPNGEESAKAFVIKRNEGLNQLPENL